MLNAIGWILKLTFLSVAILIAGEWIRWDGHTLAQHVMQGIGSAEKSGTASYLRDLTRKVTEDARTGFDKKAKSPGRIRVSAAQQRATAGETPSAQEEEALTDRTKMQAAAPMQALAAKSRNDENLPPSERQKLKALIRELNGPGE